MVEINLMDQYPRTKRPIAERGATITDEDRKIAREFGQEWFDGSRNHGYGGYYYNPRFWQSTVRRFQEYYNLTPDAKILDIGCAKGFMLHDFKEFMPDISVAGIDISKYGIENAIETVKPYLKVANANSLPYEDNSFDLVISINTIHNLPLTECKTSLREITRVTKKHSFLTVDAWRTDDERQKFLDWNLTALTYMHADEWKNIFDEVDYTGDYYWFIAE